MAIVFICRNGSLAGKRFEFGEPLVSFGRKPTNMVRFAKEQEPGVSNTHCEVFLHDGAYYVRDMASANGTFLDGVPVKVPVPLRDGSVIQLGNPGPELVVSLPYEEALTMRMAPGALGKMPPPPGAAPVVPQAAPQYPAALSEPMPQYRDGIGMPTLMATLDKAKAEVRNEYGNRMRWVYIAGAGVLLFAAVAVVILVVWLRASNARNIQEVQAENERKIKEMQDKWLAQMDQSKKDADNRYNEIKKNTDASTQTKLEQLQKLLDDKTKFMEKLATDAKGVGVSSDAVNQEMLRNREALKAIQAQIGDLTAFVSFKERYSKCVYSLVLKFTEGGEVKYSFVGTAFCLSTSQGLLGTTARVVEALKPLLQDGKLQLIARCNGDAQYNYLVTQTFAHPDFKPGDAGIGKDVAILKLNLRSLKADGTFGAELPLPAALQAAPDEELDQVVSGVNVAVFGFSDQDRAKLESETPVTGAATLSTNIVDGTTSFASEPVAGRRYDLLKHNCTVPKGFAGAPVVNTKNRVVGIQSNTIAPGAARSGTTPNSAWAVSIKVLQDLQAQFLKRQADGK